jgi:glycosyltransferase involved in cell wall biosynthesis
LTLYPAIRRDNTAQNLARKERIWAHSELYLSAPCNWLLSLAKQAALGRTAIEARVIHNGVDTTVFAPGDRSTARLLLGLPLDAHVILYAAARGPKNLWRDFSTLRLALQQLGSAAPSVRTRCVVLGSAAPDEHIGQIEVHFVERQTDPRRVALFYQAADVYAHPTRADTFPLAVLEALACGTPVVASAVGGIPEQVRHMAIPGLSTPGDVPDAGVADATGVLVHPANAGALAAALAFVLDDEPRRRLLAANARRDVLVRFSLDDAVDNWLAWYGEMMARAGAPEQN